MAGRQRKVLVTGSSNGIGLEIAKTLLEKGFYVIVHGTGSNKSEFEKLNKSYPEQVGSWWFDLNEDPTESFGALLKSEGPIWALVNNAGIIPENNIWSCNYENLHDLFRVNVFSSFVISSQFVESVDPEVGARIVNISSIAIKFGMGRNQGIQYAATKSALEALNTGLSRLGASKNILVNAIRPGCILTRIQKDRPDFKERVDLIPVKRMGTEKEIAGAVEYFLSDSASFTTGQVLSVAGGE